MAIHGSLTGGMNSQYPFLDLALPITRRVSFEGETRAPPPRNLKAKRSTLRKLGHTMPTSMVYKVT